MKKHNVLVDLKIAMNNGYCGIAKENRLIFKMLSQSENIKVDGLLLSSALATLFSKYKKSASREKLIAQANYFFHEALNHEPLLRAKLLSKLKLAFLFALKQKKFHTYAIDDLFNEVIWRRVFDKTLGAEDKELLLKNDFCFSDLTAKHLSVAAYFNKKLHLDTSAYDFAVFLEPNPIKVSPNTIKLVRYHDAIPITEPDLSGSLYSHCNLNLLDESAKDAYFICNSEPTREVLLNIRPALESKAFVIPVGLSSNYQKIQDEKIVKQIMATRLSNQIATPERLPHLREQIQEMKEVNYIFNLATLDPKKNHVQLIRAWEKLCYQYGDQLKLVIAANRGWDSREIEEVMRPHIDSGHIIHLENLPIDELPYLFSHAKAFVFPSYTEGFGIPPLEAMQCECPVIASDIPAHRWVLGDAALYCDPYHPQALTETLEKLIYLPSALELRERLGRLGLERVKRYRESTLSEQWAALFETIKT